MLNAVGLHLVSIVIYVILLIVLIKKKTPIIKHVTYFVFYVYIIAVLSVTMFPIPIQKELIRDRAVINFIEYDFVPFVGILEIIKLNNISIILRQLGGNIILFIPLGYLVPVIFKNVNSLVKIGIVGFISSFAIEFIQGILGIVIGVKFKIVDVNDIILNVIGVIVGFLLYKIMVPFVRKYSPVLNSSGENSKTD